MKDWFCKKKKKKSSFMLIKRKDNYIFYVPLFKPNSESIITMLWKTVDWVTQRMCFYFIYNIQYFRGFQKSRISNTIQYSRISKPITSFYNLLFMEIKSKINASFGLTSTQINKHTHTHIYVYINQDLHFHGIFLCHGNYQ